MHRLLADLRELDERGGWHVQGATRNVAASASIPEEAELVWTMLNHAATQLARESAPPAIDDSAESQTMPAAQRAAATPSPGDVEICDSNDSAESRE